MVEHVLISARRGRCAAGPATPSPDQPAPVSTTLAVMDTGRRRCRLDQRLVRAGGRADLPSRGSSPKPVAAWSPCSTKVAGAQAYRTVETYRPEPGARVGCPLTVLVGDRDPRVSRVEAEAWQSHTSGAFELRQFPGGHFYLWDRLPEVAAAVQRELPV
ncbi:thioesterase II family protein [Nocardia sp. CA-084685]|uniref:thioesterase II family protein n=1 Tax=Nocardia sp. CA-084685 TaxID=3239970 RepID=UPI003D98B619